MAETAARLVDCVIPPVPVRQWVLSLPIPLRLLLAVQPQLLAPLLQAIHRVIAGFLVKRAGFKLSRADTGAVTLIQRFGSAANLNIHLHCLVLDGVYLNRDGAAVFHEAAAPSIDELEAVLLKIIARTMRTLTRLGALIEEPEVSYLAETDSDGALRSLQAASCTYRLSRSLSDRSARYNRGFFIKHKRKLTTLPIPRYSSGHRKGRLKILFISPVPMRWPGSERAIPLGDHPTTARSRYGVNKAA